MTEEEWAHTEDWDVVLAMVGLPLSVRKLQLWIIIICRLGWTERDPSELIYVMDQIEKYIDGSISHQEFVRAINFVEFILDQEKNNLIAEILSQIHYWQLGDLYGISQLRYNIDNMWSEGTLLIADLARDIFGNPFRPVAFEPSWRTSTAIAVARQMYESRDFAAMPILADALQDAGCESTEVLDHCHDPKGIHARGCWVVDRVLAKE